jgi:hypothetical protein
MHSRHEEVAPIVARLSAGEHINEVHLSRKLAFTPTLFVDEELENILVFSILF